MNTQTTLTRLTGLGRQWLPTCLCALLLFPATSHAKVDQAEADQLGTTLTPMGAEKEGNAAGTIPPYTGAVLGAPTHVNYQGPGQHYPDPYADEEPLFTISAANYQEYEQYLSTGQTPSPVVIYALTDSNRCIDQMLHRRSGQDDERLQSAFDELNVHSEKWDST